MYILTKTEEILCKEIVDSAFYVHNELGPGFLEKYYEVCFCHILNKKGIEFKRQIHLPIVFDGLTFEEGLRLDVFVQNSIICEIKVVDIVNPVWIAQILSHLKLTNVNIGFVLNFNVPLMKEGIRRYCRSDNRTKMQNSLVDKIK